MKRNLSLTLNPAGLMGAALAVYAAVVMILNAYHHHGVIDTPVIVAAISAVAALFTRTAVTPTRDPRDGAGRALVPAEVTVIVPGQSGKTALDHPPAGDL